MFIGSGTRLGPYEVSGLIGSGGMGEVYRARDPRLNREVAIKILPAAYAEDASRLRRFEQEARAAAGLNHPNILSVYDLGMHDGAPFIVGELLDGETVRTRLRLGRIPVRKAIEYSLQIARGLAAAHDKGIVHRDLKPDNIFICRDGTVKILDFGLAKLLETPRGPLDATRTLDSDAGMIVGTVGYMSPEQVRGKPVDARTDLFAFGAILYEVLSGQRAFKGDSAADTLTAILTKDPPELLQGDGQIPPSLDRIVRHCLEKSPDERFQSARDIAFALEALTSASSASTAGALAAPEKKAMVSRRAAIAISALALFILGLLLGRALVGKPQPATYRQLTYRRGTIRSARFAPGGQIVYAAAWDGSAPELFVCNVNTPGSSATGIHASDVEAISNSGEVLLISDRHFAGAYVRPGTLSRASLTGAAPRPIMEEVQAADWSADGTKIAVARVNNGQFQLEFPVGKIIYTTTGWITNPRISPDGQSVAFLDHPVYGDDGGSVAIVGLDGKKQTLTGNYASIQTLTWYSTSALWFSATSTGVSTNIYSVDLKKRVQTIVQAPGGLRVFDIAPDGRAVVAQGHTRLSAMALGYGQTKERDLSVADWSLAADMTEDGRTVLIDEEADGTPGGAYSVYIRNTDGSPPTRLGQGSALRISPDQKLVLAETPDSKPQMQLLPTGAGEPRILHGDVQPALAGNACWLPDSKHFVFPGIDSKGERRVYLWDTEGGTPTPITRVGFIGAVRCSHDGKNISVSDRRQTWIVPLSGATPKPVPGGEPNEFALNWTKDDRALLMITPLQNPAKIYRLDIATGRRELVKEVEPQDLTGIESVGPIIVTPDARYYVYGFGRNLTDLYVVDGLK